MKTVLILTLLLFSSLSAYAETELFEFKVAGSACGSPECPSSIISEYQDGYLETTVTVSTNCAHMPHKPSYQFEKDTIIFSFETFSPSGAIAHCLCPNTIMFRLAIDSGRHAGEFAASNKRDIKVKVMMDGNEISPNRAAAPDAQKSARP